MTRRIRLQRRRERGAYPPSRQRRARLRLRPRPHHKQRHVRSRSSQRQPPRSDKVERLGRAPRLDYHGAQRRTSRRLLARTQHRRPIARPHEDETVRGETEFGNAGRINLAHLHADKILTHPDDRALGGCAYRQHHAKACSGRFIRRLRREDFMQRPPIEPALQRRIELRRARGKAIGRRRGRAALQPGHLPSQCFQISFRHRACPS